MATTNRPGDLTGRQRSAAAKAAKEEHDLREQELTMATAAKEIALTNEVVDYTGAQQAADDVDLGEVTLESEKTVTIRVNEHIKDMTYGAGNYFTFEVGPKYKVPVALANHLDALGYVWH